MMFSQPKMHRVLGLAILSIIMLLGPAGVMVFADEPQKDGVQASAGSGLLATIQHMEALLLRPCDKVELLMNDLILNGSSYQRIEGERAAIYKEWTKEFTKDLSDFVVMTDEKGTAVPGRFITQFIDLKKAAEEGGVLAEGPKPAVSLVQLAHSKNKSSYFYFDDPDSAQAGKKRDLRYKLEEGYEKLVADWNTSRDKFYKEFDTGGKMKTFAGTLDEKTKLGKEVARQYTDTRGELTVLALGGDYEHCLGGTFKALAYTIQGAGGILDSLYGKGQDGTPDSLPGMGYKLIAQEQYKPLEKPDIGDFPLALYLKFNGADYLKLEKELLEIKIKAEEDETLILGGCMGRLGQFGFSVIHKTAEGLAAPVKLVEYVVSHPVDSMGKAVDMVKNIPRVVQDIGNVNVLELNKKAGDFLWGTTEKLFVAAGEIAKDITPIAWDRFDPKPGETMEQQVERLKAKLESTTKVKEGMEVASTITSIVVQALLDKGITKGLGKADDIVAGIKQQQKASELLKKVDMIDDQAKALKQATATSSEVKNNAKSVKEIAEEQLKLNKGLQDFITGPPDRVPGQPLTPDKLAEKPLKFVDKDGRPVEIPVGKELGSGATSKAFVNGGDDGLVVRVTEVGTEKAKKAQFLDEFGRKAVDDEVKSPFLRTAKRENVMEVVNEKGVPQHVEYVEKVKPAKDYLAEQGGTLKQGQKLALEQATRDLNAKGYAWVDNHAGNYAFEKLPGEDRWKVVVFDTGGIYPMKGANAVEKAANARGLQNKISETEDSLRALGIKNENMYAGSVRSAVYEKGGDPISGIDLDKVGMKKVEEIGVGAGTGLRPDMGDLYTKPADEVMKQVDDHVSKAISGDPAFKEMRAKYDSGQTKLDEAMKKLESQVDKAQGAVDVDPKAPPPPDKPSGIDKTVADRMNFLSQVAAKTINAENCALLRQSLLAGSKEDWLMKAIQDCTVQGL